MKTYLLSLGVASLLGVGELFGADQASLWPIQQALAAKKYVDLTHDFAPGIPRWPGFPDETRKTIYWYDKRPDTMGAGTGVVKNVLGQVDRKSRNERR